MAVDFSRQVSKLRHLDGLCLSTMEEFHAFAVNEDRGLSPGEDDPSNACRQDERGAAYGADSRTLHGSSEL